MAMVLAVAICFGKKDGFIHFQNCLLINQGEFKYEDETTSILIA